jgi:hypothetical protein
LFDFDRRFVADLMAGRAYPTWYTEEDALEVAIGCGAIFFVTLCALAFFYFHVPIVFILIGALAAVRLILSVIPGWQIASKYGMIFTHAPVGCFLYVNLAVLVISAIFHIFDLEMAEYGTLAILALANIVWLRIGGP